MLRKSQGFTLIEALATVAIVGILVALAVPAMGQFREKGLLKNAAEDAVGALHFGKAEAIKRGNNVYVKFDGDGSSTWCYGIAENSGCDCTVTNTASAGACKLPVHGTDVLKQVSSTGFPDIVLAATTYEANFDEVRGTTPANTLVFTSSNYGFEIRVVVSTLGRIRTCSPAGNAKVVGYDDC